MYSTGSIIVSLVGVYFYSIIFLSTTCLHISALLTQEASTTHKAPITENSTSVTTEVPEDDDTAVVIILPESENETDVESNLTLLQTVILLEHFNGTGLFESIELLSGQCHPVPQLWSDDQGHPVAALKHDKLCVRFWETSRCRGRTRCYCDPELLSLDESLPLSNETLWFGNLNGLSMCYVENDTFSRAMLFSEPEFQGHDSSIILAPKECVTLYRGDKWQDEVKSIIVTDGCVEYFTQEECKGDGGKKLEAAENVLGKEWEGKIRSFRNCAGDDSS